MNADQRRNLSVNFLLFVSTEKLFKLLTVREVPDFDGAVSSRSNQSTAFHVEGSRSDLGVEGLGEFRVNVALSLEP